MSDRLQWRRDGRDWPNRTFSRFVRAGGIDWHVQEMGQGPKLLLLHGTAAFAFFAGDESVKRLIGNMGSKIDRDGIGFYKRLMGNPVHVAGALGMMARWDLDGLARDLPGLKVPLTLVTAAGDRAVPPDTAARVKALLPSAEVRSLRGGGHLAHEEKPAMIADLIIELARRDGVLQGP